MCIQYLSILVRAERLDRFNMDGSCSHISQVCGFEFVLNKIYICQCDRNEYFEYLQQKINIFSFWRTKFVVVNIYLSCNIYFPTEPDLTCNSFSKVHMLYISPTFTHGADGAPGLVRPAGDSAAAFDLLTFGTGDSDRLSNMKLLLGSVPTAVVPPAWRSRARLGCKEQKWKIIF